MAPLGIPRRLAGMMLLAPRRCRMCWWLGSRIKLRIRQHQADGRASCGHVQQSRQIAHVGSWSSMRPLREQNLLLHIHHNDPLQPMPMPWAAVRMLFQSPYEKGADGIIGEPRAIDGYGNRAAAAAAQATHGFAQPAIH